MARASNQLMRISWPVFALCLLWVAGLAVNYQSIRSGWDREQETLSYYAKTLTELQRLARRLKIVGVLKDKDPEFDRYLIGQLVDLEERSFAVMSLPYQPLRYAFAAASTLRDDLRRLRDTLQAAYEPDIDREANRISAASFELLTNIASVSPGDFVLRVYSRSIFLAAAAFGPVTALIGWSFLSPLMKRRAARLRVRDATPKH